MGIHHFLIGDASSNGCFYIVMLVFGGAVALLIHFDPWLPSHNFCCQNEIYIYIHAGGRVLPLSRVTVKVAFLYHLLSKCKSKIIVYSTKKCHKLVVALGSPVGDISKPYLSNCHPAYQISIHQP